MYSIYAISNTKGTENVKSAETEESAKETVETPRMILHAGVFSNKTSLTQIDDFGYDQLD